MQITVSLEELRQFEESYKRWADGFNMAGSIQEISKISDELRAEMRPQFMAFLDRSKLAQENWLKRNPEPKLIPSV